MLLYLMMVQESMSYYGHGELSEDPQASRSCFDVLSITDR